VVHIDRVLAIFRRSDQSAPSAKNQKDEPDGADDV
jgi:hypothetical protein